MEIMFLTFSNSIVLILENPENALAAIVVTVKFVEDLAGILANVYALLEEPVYL